MSPKRKCCCCNDCERILPSGTNCCCRCVCDTLCVTIAIPSDADCDCDEGKTEFAYDCATNSWHGTVDCLGLSVDLDFSVKTCDDKCYVCLTSTCLSKAGTCPGDCIEFSGGLFCRGTYTGIERTGGFDVTFTGINFSGCGDSDCGTGTITISCADRIFPSCRSTDCVAPLCDGCSCIPRCICVQYNDDDCPETEDCDNQLNNRACWDSETQSWHLVIECGSNDVDLDFRIQKNESTGVCEVLLTSVELGISDSNPEPSETSTNNPQTLLCPNLGNNWEFDLNSDRIISIHLLPDACDICIPRLGCCTARETPAPGKLSVEIEITGAHDCDPSGCSDGGNINFDIFLVGTVRRGDAFPDPDFSCASKYVGTTTWCDQPATMTVWICDTCAGGGGSSPGITVEFQTCSGSNVHCSTGGTGCDCRSMACDPIFFTTSDSLGDGGCCNPDDTTTMDITIMEPA